MTAGQHAIGLIYHDNAKRVQREEERVPTRNELPQAACAARETRTNHMVGRTAAKTREHEKLQKAQACTWRSYNYMRMAGKQALLFLHGHAADDCSALEAGVGGELPEQ